jgi:hypothetical protein
MRHHDQSWDSLCTKSSEKEKAEIAERYNIRFGPTELYCARCGDRIANPLNHTCVDLGLKEHKPTVQTHVDREKWTRIVKEMFAEYEVERGTKKDLISARRIAMILGEEYLRQRPPQGIWNIMILEKDLYELALENRLTCNMLERETKVKPHLRGRVLEVWGVDKRSGFESFVTDLKEWTIRAMTEEGEVREDDFPGSDSRSGVNEISWLEEERIGLFEERERDAIRPIE